MSEILNKQEIEQFIQNGYVRIDHAFSKELADAALELLWKDLPCDRHDPTTWKEPVIRLGMYTDEPFISSLNTPKLVTAYNQLVGEQKWIPCRSVGTFPVRFPSEKAPMDTGKHVDVSFPGADPNNYFEWRANINSKSRALLLLALYSDVSENDAPTVLLEGSHGDIARLLAPKGILAFRLWKLRINLKSYLSVRKSWLQVKQERYTFATHF